MSADMGSQTMDERPATPTRHRSRWPWWLPAAILLLVIGFAAYRLIAGGSATPQYGIAIDSPTPAGDFTLQSSRGAVSLSDFRGKPVLLYFGYTTCPDVCPTTLADLRMAMQELGEDQSKVQVLFVSVDPERDTVERLGAYLQYFDPNFIGLTGPLAEIEAIANRFGVFFQKNVVDSAADYLIDHTSAVLLLDADGKLRLMFPYATTGKQIADDTRLFIR